MKDTRLFDKELAYNGSHKPTSGNIKVDRSLVPKQQGRASYANDQNSDFDLNSMPDYVQDSYEATSIGEGGVDFDLNSLPDYVPQQQANHSLLDRAKEFARPIVSGALGTIDAIGNYGANIYDKDTGSYSLSPFKEHKETPFKLKETALESSVLTPNAKPDFTSKVMSGLGETAFMIAPMNVAAKGLSIVGKGGKLLKLPLVDKVARILNTPLNKMGLATAAGASIGSTSAEELVDDEYTPSEIKVAASILGSIAGGITTSLAPGIVSKVLKAPIKAVENPNMFFKNITKEQWDAVPSDIVDKKTVKLIVDSGFTPTDPLIRKKMPLLMTYLTSDNAYKSALDTLDKTTLSSVKRSLDKIKISDNPNVADEFESSLKEALSGVRKESSDLYAKSDALIKDTDKILPNNTYQTIGEILKVSDAIPGSGGISSKVGAIGNAVLGSENINLTKGLSLKDTVNIRKRIRAIKDSIPAEDVSSRRDIDNIKRALDLDIEDAIDSGIIDNKEFILSHKESNKYYKDIAVPLLKSSMVRNILSGEDPNYVFKTLSNASGARRFNLLEKDTIRSNPSKRDEITELFNTYRKTKLEELFNKRSTDKSNVNFSIKGAFSTKANDSLIKELAGDELYKELKSNADVIQSSYSNVRDLLNKKGSFDGFNITPGKIPVGVSAASAIGVKGTALLTASIYGLNSLYVKIFTNKQLSSKYLKTLVNGGISDSTINFLRTTARAIGINLQKEEEQLR